MGDYTKVDDPNHPRWAATCDGMPRAEELEASARRMREQNPLWAWEDYYQQELIMREIIKEEVMRTVPWTRQYLK